MRIRPDPDPQQWFQVLNAVICGPTWGVMRVGLAGKLRLVAGGAVALISGRGGGAGAVALISGRGGGAGPNSGRTGAAPPRLTVATVTLGILNAKQSYFFNNLHFTF
jgi:hypothetical protein